MGTPDRRGDRWAEAVLGCAAGAALASAPFLPWVTGEEVGDGVMSPDAFELARELDLAPAVGAAWVVVGFGGAVLVIALLRLFVRGRLLRAVAILLGASAMSLVAVAGGAFWIGWFFVFASAGASAAPGIGLVMVVLGSAAALAAPLISGPEEPRRTHDGSDPAARTGSP